LVPASLYTCSSSLSSLPHILPSPPPQSVSVLQNCLVFTVKKININHQSFFVQLTASITSRNNQHKLKWQQLKAHRVKFVTDYKSIDGWSLLW
jgi:hypothetical protein